MDEKDDVQRLIALKRYETPGDAYFEEFFRHFRDRQRSEVLRCPAHRLVLERADTWMRSVQGYRWAFGVLGALLVSAAATFWVGSGQKEVASGKIVTLDAPDVATSNLLIPSASPDFQPNPVRLYWEGNGPRDSVSGLEIADGMFVCAWPGAQVSDAVRVLRPPFEAQARVVLVDDNSGLVVLDSRGP